MSFYCDCGKKGNPRKIDVCLNNGLLGVIKLAGYTPVASCCGHGRHPMTIVIQNLSGEVWEFFSGKTIPRKTRFYVKDKQGHYYIPEVQ